jgi:hypothetical protein
MTYVNGAIAHAYRMNSEHSGSQAFFFFEHVVCVCLDASLAMKGGQKASLKGKYLEVAGDVETAVEWWLKEQDSNIM